MKCPKCGEEIYRLNFERKVKEYGQIENGLTYVDDAEALSAIVSCPECGEKITDSIDDAIRMLEKP